MSEETRKSTAGVIAPPPLLVLAALLLGLGLDRLSPISLVAQIAPAIRYALGAAFFLAAAWLLLSASGGFVRAKTARAPWAPTTVLVTSGVYAHTRNPMYVAFFLVLIALAFALASDWCFATLVLLFFAIHFGVVMREEPYLEQLFGEDYRVYKTRVPRYLWKL